MQKDLKKKKRLIHTVRIIITNCTTFNHNIQQELDVKN